MISKPPYFSAVCAAVVVLSVPFARGEDPPPSFRDDVVPLLTRLGCNAGACHGKLAGQNGFRLSLRGYAPQQDHEWMTREFEGRRINRAFPEQSLLLEKPLARVQHGGGKLLSEGSRDHETLLRWIASGAPGLIADEPAIERIEVLPGSRAGATLSLSSFETQQLLVLAHTADGSTRDVTWLCKFVSGDEAVLGVSAGGLVTCHAPGEAVVRVHFQQHVEAVSVTAPYPNELLPRDDLTRNNPIDEHVFDKLEALRIPAAKPCDDATFLRRAMLDTIGRLPTAAEARQFDDDPRMDKRSRLVDALLERPEFVDYWTLQLADLLQNRKERDHDVRGLKGVRAMHDWLRRQVKANRPWNELARDVLTAEGDSITSPQIGYYVVTIGEKRQAEQSEVAASVAQSFLGTRIGCAQCHNHPLEKYTQDDYYRFAGFFVHTAFERRKPEEGATELYVAGPQRADLRRRIAQLEQKLAQAANDGQPADEKARKQLARQREQLETSRQELASLVEQPPQVRQPRTGEMLSPRPLDGRELAFAAGADPRAALVDWMVEPGNEHFSGNMVNRLWKHFFSAGLVEPVDDLRASNPPSNRPLWDYLRAEFVASGYDLKHVMRLILKSQAYQLGSETTPENAAERRFYSHYYARRLPAEVMSDAICDATGVPEQFSGYPLGVRAVQLPSPDADSYFLTLFGRPDRITACACERSDEVTMPQVLHMMNGDWITRKVRAGDGWLMQTLKAEADDRRVLDEIFLRTLSRLPRADERAQVDKHLIETADREAAFIDILWALINSKEFAFNH